MHTSKQWSKKMVKSPGWPGIKGELREKKNVLLKRDGR